MSRDYRDQRGGHKPGWRAWLRDHCGCDWCTGRYQEGRAPHADEWDDDEWDDTEEDET